MTKRKTAKRKTSAKRKPIKRKSRAVKVPTPVLVKAPEPTKEEQLHALGEQTASTLAAMVAAMGVNWDRLEELREAKADAAREGVDFIDAEELAELEEAAGDCENEDDARQRVLDDPLSIEVRGDWHAPGDGSDDVEFMILLGTGGPAMRIRGELRNGEPYRAWIEVQDWFTAWTEYHGNAIEQDELLTYCQCFHFGE